MKYNRVYSNINYLNLGCGYRYNPDWTNVDFIATGKDVLAYDLNQGIPFANDTFDFVYHSHVLEHFSRATAQQFIQECCRVLRPGGILRVVVPDLEQIVRLYLTSLEKAQYSPEWSDNYAWIVLELLDQMVRNRRGGDMAVYLAQDKIRNQEFVFERFGGEAANMKKSRHSDRQFKFFYGQVKQLGTNWYQLLPKFLKKLDRALRIGYFRQSGEVHQWMYDHYSLSILLENCGLEEVVRRTATDSYCDRWIKFDLDTESDGRIYKPDSLFMEALKPTHQATL